MKTRVSKTNNSNDDAIMYLNPNSMKMIIPYYVSTEQSKSATKKKKTYEKVHNSETKHSLHVKTMNRDKEYVPNPNKKSISLAKNVIKELHVCCTSKFALPFSLFIRLIT